MTQTREIDALPQPASSVPDMAAMGALAKPAARVFHTLDALRGIAAVGVVIFHMGGLFAPIAAPGGYLAVDLFFMMSGVVLSHAYEGRFRAGMGTIGFMRARLIRLYPLYILGLVFGLAVTVASLRGRNIQNWDALSVLRAATLALFLLPNFFTRPTNAMFPLNIPCWSLFLEVLVNLLFVIFWRLLTSRRLVLASLLTGAVVGLAIARNGSIDQGAVGSGIAVGLARAVFGFSVGVLISRHLKQVHQTESNLAVLAIIAVAGFAIAAAPGTDMRPIWDAVCVLVIFPVIVWSGTAIDPGPRLRPVFTFLGTTSYAVYVLHSPLSAIINSASRFFDHGLSGRIGTPYLGITVLAGLLIGCWLVDRFFDVPIRRLLSHIVPKAPQSGSLR